MPTKEIIRARKRRRQFRKPLPLRPRRRQVATLSIGHQIVPDRLLVALKYTAGIQLDSGGAGSIASHVFRGNSLFDPDFTGGGAQPTGFDQWAAFYERYRVRASSFKVYVRTETPGSSNTMTMGVIVPKTVTTLDTNFANSTGEPYAKVKMVANQEAGYPSTIKSYISTKKILGLTKRESSDVDYSALVTTNPLNQWFWHFYIEDAITAGSNIKSKMYIELMYYTEFYKRKSLDRS